MDLSKFLSDKSLLEKIKFRSMILPDRFIEHNDPKKMYEEAGLDSQAIENKIYEIIDSKILAQKHTNRDCSYSNTWVVTPFDRYRSIFSEFINSFSRGQNR